MSIAQIQQSMEMNRQSFAERAEQIKRDPRLAPLQRQRDLAQLWLDAMRAHYQLLSDYLSLRDTGCVGLTVEMPRLQTWQLRAPERPIELPESLSRYVTVTHHAEHLI